jgi:hypothetical protein
MKNIRVYAAISEDPALQWTCEDEVIIELAF